jgi:glutamate 5-kinase
MFRLLELGAIPIINENDTIATEEISVGDNDTLGAIVAECVCSDLLVILSDIDGLYTADPRKDRNATFISRVEEITPDIEALAGGSGSSLGTGGMATKLHAARIATQAGFDMVIANGARPEILYDIVDGKRVGTRFVGRKTDQGSKTGGERR